jgi:hypothetical protein
MLLLALVGLGGCGEHSTASSLAPLGRALSGEPATAIDAPTPSGDPPAERNGTVAQAAAENEPMAGSLASSPRAAVRRYALAYTNWQANSLPAHERRLATLAVGAARLTAEQIAASESSAAELAADHVQNKSVVLAIAPGQGLARGQWVVVTEEQTTGTGPFAGLPAAPHVTLARTARAGSGWAVSEWSPRS